MTRRGGCIFDRQLGCALKLELLILASRTEITGVKTTNVCQSSTYLLWFLSPQLSKYIFNKFYFKLAQLVIGSTV